MQNKIAIYKDKKCWPTIYKQKYKRIRTKTQKGAYKNMCNCKDKISCNELDKLRNVAESNSVPVLIKIIIPRG